MSARERRRDRRPAGDVGGDGWRTPGGVWIIITEYRRDLEERERQRDRVHKVPSWRTTSQGGRVCVGDDRVKVPR